ncbi:MAG: P-loop NTPase [Alphaproteobacteria bacterium]|nr:P-loop NTPase [Alphaproteobacteria bacterium]
MTPTIISIGSCKGGVGKSTVTSFIATLLSHKAKVGVLDADLYGPSLYSIWNITTQDTQLKPIMVDSIQCLSLDGTHAPNTALLWRAPLLHKTIKAMLHPSVWENCDILLVDLPPGTGDIAMTLAQSVSISGHIIVTTPHHLAVNESLVFQNFCATMNIPLLGTVLNFEGMYDLSASIGKLLKYAPLITQIPFLPFVGTPMPPKDCYLRLQDHCPHFCQDINALADTILTQCPVVASGAVYDE